MVLFSALLEICGVFLPVLPIAFLSMLNASNWLLQAGSVYYSSSVFSVFLVSCCHERGVFFLQPEHLPAAQNYQDPQNSTIRFHPHSTSVGVRKKIVGFFGFF